MADLDVLIPHYNDVDGLRLSLDSVASQTWGGRVRVVVADDGSEEQSYAGIVSLVEAQPFSVTLIRNPVNRGRPYTRNLLLDALESPYAAWLDSGDEWYPEKIATQMAAARLREEQDEAFWITCNYNWLWQSPSAHGPMLRQQRTAQDQIRALLDGKNLRAYLWTLLGPSHTFRNVGWFDERLTRLQDLDFCLRFVTRGGRFYLPEADAPLCVYHKSDIGRNADEIRSCYALIFDKHRVLYNRYGTRFCRDKLFAMELHSARFARNNLDTRRESIYMLRAMRFRPRRLLAHMWKVRSRPRSPVSDAVAEVD